MKPPSSTKSAVYRWNKEIATICQEIERLHTHFLSRLHKEYERICKECLDQVEKWRVRHNFFKRNRVGKYEEVIALYGTSALSLN